ncbi:MAG: hypothetical protein B6I20_05995 [Bacteroidetes bacterium 4572_117]|nr:MAG: hypothetical protein B6I20_05995 [Bacteroidetes bacterium 4572_117]
MNIKISPNRINSLQIFQLLRYAANILISILFAKSYLSTYEIGEYESFIFYFSIFSFFWLTGLIQTLLSLSNNCKSEKDVKTLLFNGFALSLMFSLLMVILSLLFLQNLFPDKDKGFTVLFLIYLLLAPSTFIIEYVILLDKQYKKLIIYGAFNFIIQILLVAIPPIIGLNLLWVFYGMLAVVFIKWLVLFLLWNKNKTLAFSLLYVKQIFLNSYHLMLSATLTSSAVFIDGIIIKSQFDANQFAIFRYGAKEFPLFLLVVTAFSNSILTSFTNNDGYTKVLNEIKTGSSKMIKNLFPVSILLILISQYIYPWVFSPDFFESHKIFDIYLLLIVSRFVFPQTVIIGMQKPNLVLKAGIVELCINIISSLILIRYYGIIGVAFGTVIAFYSEKLLLVYMVNKKLGVAASKFIDLKNLLVFSVVLWFLYFAKIYWL